MLDRIRSYAVGITIIISTIIISSPINSTSGISLNNIHSNHITESNNTIHISNDGNDMTKSSSSTSHDRDNDSDNHDKKHNKKTIKIAHMGNSIQYYNDCPRLLQQMIQHNDIYYNHPNDVIQDSCLRGGSTTSSLWKEGNGMKTKFTSDRALEMMIETDGTQHPQYDIGSTTIHELLTKHSWDYVIINDYTQGPARQKLRDHTIRTLKEHIIPLLYHNDHTTNSHATNNNNNKQRKKITIPIIIQTQAYHSEGIKDTKDLGTFDEFTNQLRDGVNEYVRVINYEFEQEQQQYCNQYDYFIFNNDHNNESSSDTIIKSIARVATVGDGYQYIRKHNIKLFHKLYSWDEFHPSPYGTWFQACILYCIILHHIPPIYNETWWNNSRYMMPSPDGDIHYQLQYPTYNEAQELRQIACHICNITIS